MISIILLNLNLKLTQIDVVVTPCGYMMGVGDEPIGCGCLMNGC